MKLSFPRFLLILCSLGFTLPALRAEELDAVKVRINERLPSLDHLKATGAVGENIRGYVEVRDGGGDASAVVAAENRDRELVYAMIAKQTGSSSETVGRARARQIAGGTGAGIWLQHSDGSWYKK